MDHLTTEEERRARWYSHVWPRFVAVEPAKKPSDLQEIALYPYSKVHSLPFEWIRDRKYELSDEFLAKVLETHGFLVISAVLSPDDCQVAIDLAWDWVEAASVAEQVRQTKIQECVRPPVSRHEPLTLSPFFPRAVEGGMMPFYGSGHSTLAWKIRSHPNVRSVFRALYNTENLISSLDGVMLWRAGREHRTDRGWFHLDQNPRHKPDRECIQGLVNLLDTTPATGGNVLVARSHVHFASGHYLNENQACADFYRDRLDEIGKDDWMEIDPNDTVVLDANNIISLLLKAGDLLLWDSRVAHCSYPARDDASMSSPSNGWIRAAAAISMMPTIRASNDILMKRKDAIHSSRTLTHWANKVAPLGEERPEQVALEQTCVETIKEWQSSQGKKVLLDWKDLSLEDKRLVVGDSLVHHSV